jgi:16S rRNA (adenine1518-N6/adenine1519-N6)-dimethyltransferase
MNDLPYANKTLGQHWLSDFGTLKYITDFAEVKETDTVLEVGPGVGTLTEVLAAKASKVVAVEYDERLATSLAAQFTNTNVEVIPDDILHFETSSLPDHYKLVANIPYYLTSNLLRVLLEGKNPPESMTLLVQKEVAERIAARPGKLSVLAISVQFYCEVELGRVVSAHMFTPPPKVESQVIKMTMLDKPRFSVDTDKFFSLIKAGFSEKRKKLKTSLCHGLGISKAETEKLLGDAKIDSNMRAQELSLDEWHQLYLEWISNQHR